MVNVQILIVNSTILSIKAKGHARYAPNGKDIVCSAISAVLAGGFNALSGQHNVHVERGNTWFEAISEPNAHDKIVLETIAVQLASIEKSYPQNIKIKIK